MRQLSNPPLLRCGVGDCHVINFAFSSDNFRSAVYKTYTRGASKNAKYCYLEAVFEAFWSAEIFLGQYSFIVVKGDGIL